MDEEQAQTMIDLLVEISSKLTEISKKLSSDHEFYDISEKLDKVISSIDDVARNTSN
ncbi:hypothetical protein AAFH68_24250 [Flavobacterium sp. CGRL1]